MSFNNRFNAIFVTLLAACALIPCAAFAASPSSGDEQVDGMISNISSQMDSKADYYFDKGDYPRVIAEYRVEVEAAPDDVHSYANAGWLMESGKDYRDAEAIYRLGCERNPGQSFPVYQLGFFYFQTVHQYGKAVAVMSKSVHDHDAGINDWKLLAHAYKMNGDLKASLATWNQINRMFPNDGATLHNIQELKAKLQKPTTAKATGQ